MGVYVRSFGELVENWRPLEGDARKNGQFFGFFLDTTGPTTTLKELEELSLQLSEMSWRDCKIFMILNPPKEYLADERYQKWVELFHYEHGYGFNRPVNFVYHNSATFDKGKPTRPKDFNPNRAYEVARELDANYDDFPCVVFFKDVHSKERIIYRLPKFLTEDDKARNRQLDDIKLERLRKLFDAMTLTRDEREELPSAQQLDKRWSNLKAHVKQVATRDRWIERYESFLRHANSIGDIIDKWRKIFL